jgi:hypothetical protein
MTPVRPGDPEQNLVVGRRRLLKACGGAALAVGATPLITSCGFLHKHAVDFGVVGLAWLDELATAIGAEPVKNVADNGLDDGSLAADWSDWGPAVEAFGEDVLEFGVIAAAGKFSPGGSGAAPEFITTTAAVEGKYRYIPDGVGWAHPVPPVVLMRVSERPKGNPRTDLLVAFVDRGQKHVVFKPWAWQALSQFVHYLTNAQDAAGRDVARAVCVLTLIPSGVRPRTGRIPEGMVDWMTYKSRNGTVELALVQESNGRPTGIVTASAIPGADGRPLIKHFRLPIQPRITV